MLWAAASLCFFGFLWAGEICVPSDNSYDEGAHLNFNDVSVDSMEKPSSLRIRIKASKTDPFRQGVDIFMGRTGNELCPCSCGDTGIYGSERAWSRSTVQIPRWKTPYSSKICGQSTRSSDISRSGLISLLKPQLQKWGCYHSSQMCS